MRILLISPLFFPHRSGVVTVVSRLASFLHEKGNYVEILTAHPGFCGQLEFKGVPVRYAASINYGKAYILSPGLLATFVGKRDFDLVHGFDYQSFASYLVMLSRRLFDPSIPFCFSPQYHPVGGSAFRTALRSVLRPIGTSILNRSDKVLCISQYERELIVRDFCLTNGKMEVIPLGVDLHDAGNETKPLRGRSVHMLYVGRLEKYKGVHLILKALSCLKGERISLSVVGAGSYENELRRLTEELRLQSKVSFIGRVSDATLDQLYWKADALVLPSLFESFGLTILEAMSYGKAVISTNVGVMYDICRLNQLQRRFVLTIPPDPQDLAEKMRLLLKEPDLVEETVRRNREILEANYSWRAVCERVARLYSSMVEEKDS